LYEYKNKRLIKSCISQAVDSKGRGFGCLGLTKPTWLLEKRKAGPRSRTQKQNCSNKLAPPKAAAFPKCERSTLLHESQGKVWESFPAVAGGMEVLAP
jgi:hypothetical protein